MDKEQQDRRDDITDDDDAPALSKPLPKMEYCDFCRNEHVPGHCLPGDV